MTKARKAARPAPLPTPLPIDPRITAFAKQLVARPDDQVLREVFADLLLDLEVPRAEEKATLLRSGALTGKRPFTYGRFYSIGSYSIGTHDRSDLPPEVWDTMFDEVSKIEAVGLDNGGRPRLANYSSPPGVRDRWYACVNTRRAANALYARAVRRWAAL